jgi:hypothetical protein
MWVLEFCFFQLKKGKPKISTDRAARAIEGRQAD